MSIAFALALIVASLAYLAADAMCNMFTVKKVGGLYHWRIGRLGGSFYWAKPTKPRASKQRKLRRGWRGFGINVNITPLVSIERMQLRTRIAFAMRDMVTARAFAEVTANAIRRNALEFA